MYEELTQEEQDKIRSGEAEQSLIDKMHRLHRLNQPQKQPESESAVKGKEFSNVELRINGELYENQVPEAQLPDQDMWQHVRQGVIEDLRQEWGADTVEALDNHGRTVVLNVEEVADAAMKKHFERGMQRLNQPFSSRPSDKDIKTIFGANASAMRGSVRLDVDKLRDHNGVVTIDEIEDGRTYNITYPSKGDWSADSILPRRSKTVYKPVRKVTLREKARAQRRARRKSR